MYCVMCVLCMQYYALLLYEMSLLKECTLLILYHSGTDTTESPIVEKRLNYIPIYSTGVIHNSMQGLNLHLCNTKEIILNIH